MVKKRGRNGRRGERKEGRKEGKEEEEGVRMKLLGSLVGVVEPLLKDLLTLEKETKALMLFHCEHLTRILRKRW